MKIPEWQRFEQPIEIGWLGKARLERAIGRELLPFDELLLEDGGRVLVGAVNVEVGVCDCCSAEFSVVGWRSLAEFFAAAEEVSRY